MASWHLRLAASLLLAAPLACAAGKAERLPEAARRERVEQLFHDYQKGFPEVPALSVAALERLRAREKVVLVDVREPAERAVSMIPGAISREEFEERGAGESGARVVAYCTIGYRSGLYAAELRRRGIDAYDLAGSILAWTHAGKPLVDARGPTRRVHVYGPEWDLAADGYEAAW